MLNIDTATTVLLIAITYSVITKDQRHYMANRGLKKGRLMKKKSQTCSNTEIIQHTITNNFGLPDMSIEFKVIDQTYRKHRNHTLDSFLNYYNSSSSANTYDCF